MNPLFENHANSASVIQGPIVRLTEDGIHRCVRCDTAGTANDDTYCANCGSINCDSHIKTEQLNGLPSVPDMR